MRLSWRQQSVWAPRPLRRWIDDIFLSFAPSMWRRSRSSREFAGPIVRCSSAMSSQMHEQGVINKGCALDDLGIALRHFVAEALADGPQSCRFRGNVDLLRKIGAVNDERQALQSNVAGKVFLDELLERAPSTFVLMR